MNSHAFMHQSIERVVEDLEKTKLVASQLNDEIIRQLSDHPHTASFLAMKQFIDIINIRLDGIEAFTQQCLDKADHQLAGQDDDIDVWL